MRPTHPEQQRQIAVEIRAERKIQAIKLYREFTHSGLKEAKDAVEAMEAGGLPSDLSPGTQGVFRTSDPSGGVDESTRRQLAAMVRAGRKIEAIKVWREKTGDGLAEAKSRVEQLAAEPGTYSTLEQRAAMQSKRGCFGMLLVAVMLAAVTTLLVFRSLGVLKSLAVHVGGG